MLDDVYFPKLFAVKGMILIVTQSLGEVKSYQVPLPVTLDPLLGQLPLLPHTSNLWEMPLRWLVIDEDGLTPPQLAPFRIKDFKAIKMVLGIKEMEMDTKMYSRQNLSPCTEPDQVTEWAVQEVMILVEILLKMMEEMMMMILILMLKTMKCPAQKTSAHHLPRWHGKNSSYYSFKSKEYAKITRNLKYFHIYFINFRPQSAYNPAASLITYCPCGCGKEDHNGGSGDSSASSTGGTLSSGSLPSPNNLSAIVNAATNLTSLQHNQNNGNFINNIEHQTKYPESPDLSPVKPFQLSSTTKAGTTTIVPTTSITQPPFHLLQPVPSVACTQAATNISPQSSSSSSYSSSSEVPLDMSKTSPMFVKSSVSRIPTTPVTMTQQQQQAKVCSIQTPPPTPPENDRDKFRCLYLLVDAAMEQLDEIAAEKRRNSNLQHQEVSSLQITIPVTHNPPTQQPPQLASLHPHQQICA